MLFFFLCFFLLMIIMVVCWWILRWQGSVRNAISQVSWWFRDPAVAKQFQLKVKAVICSNYLLVGFTSHINAGLSFQQQISPQEQTSMKLQRGPPEKGDAFWKSSFSDSLCSFSGVYQQCMKDIFRYSYHRWWSDPLDTLISRWRTSREETQEREQNGILANTQEHDSTVTGGSCCLFFCRLRLVCFANW